MTDTILQMLQWAIPSGGIGAAIAWIANRKVNAAQENKSIHDTYKLMYEDVSKELLITQKKVDDNTQRVEALNQENSKTRRALNRLSRAIEAIQLCPYRDNCPVNGELSLSLDSSDDTKEPAGAKKRQHRRQPDHDKAVDDARRESRHGTADTAP